jgi:hypothetical protein
LARALTPTRPARRSRAGRAWAPLTWAFLLLTLFAWAPGAERAAAAPSLGPPSDRQHIVYFEGTGDELEVYKIFGRETGPTVMILGGIQGDEPGAFLSADLYVDLALKKGNLIVVPRANFKSIIAYERGSDGDMNRKFAAGVTAEDPDLFRVDVIKNLMAESDLFLNLHDGSGFFRTSWESEMANPQRYGQCVIADAEVFTFPATGRVIHLGQDARRAVDIVNREIPEENYKFRFANHDTLSSRTSHREQRQSATYYALTVLGIPAFGIETSKQLPSLEMKIRQHNLAVNAFLELYGVEVEHPRIYLDPPELRFLLISVNGGVSLAVRDGQTLLVNPGDRVEVVYIGANYDRGLTVDAEGVGGLNDINVPLVIEKPTALVVRRDNSKFGKVYLAFHGEEARGAPPALLERAGGALATAEAGALPGLFPSALGDGWPPLASNEPALGAVPGVGVAPPGNGSVGIPAGPEGPDGPDGPDGTEGTVTTVVSPAGAGPEASPTGGQETVAASPEGRPGPSVSSPLSPPRDGESAGEGGVSAFLLEVDGTPRRLAPEETLVVPAGAKVKLVAISSLAPLPPTVVMNLKGFVGRPGDVTGNDAGTVCDTAKDTIARFAIRRGGRTVFQLGAEDGPRTLAKAYLAIARPILKSATFTLGAETKTLGLAGRWKVSPGTLVTLTGIELEDSMEWTDRRLTLGGRAVSADLPTVLTMPDIAVSLAVFAGDQLAGKVVLFP